MRAATYTVLPVPSTISVTMVGEFPEVLATATLRQTTTAARTAVETAKILLMGYDAMPLSSELTGSLSTISIML
jgi:hypothetical protein